MAEPHTAKAAFTPGPWYLSSYVESFGHHEITSPYDSCWIAKVQVHKNCVNTSREVSDGNAQLISAATELYLSLKALIEPRDMRKAQDRAEFDIAIVKAKAALAKAEGRND